MNMNIQNEMNLKEYTGFFQMYRPKCSDKMTAAEFIINKTKKLKSMLYQELNLK
mgnify:CR=1 FL=1